MSYRHFEANAGSITQISHRKRRGQMWLLAPSSARRGGRGRGE